MIRSTFLAASLLSVSLCAAPSWAQPIGRPAPVAPNAAPAAQVEATVRSFVDALNGQNIYFNAVDKVFGVTNYGYFGGPQWGAAWAKKRGALRLEIEKIAVSELTATGAKARVDYFWRGDQLLFRSKTLSETLQLIVGTPPSAGEKPRFQIVSNHAPATREEALQTYHRGPPVDARGNVILPDNETVLGEAAFEIAFPGEAQKRKNQYQSLENGEKSLHNLRQLGLAALQFTEDYDQKFALAPEFFEEAFLPYSHQPEISRSPATGEAYTFNANLSGKSSSPTILKNAARVVMFYEGQNQTPMFRYAGSAAILFADGHAALVPQLEIQTLIWKP